MASMPAARRHPMRFLSATSSALIAAATHAVCICPTAAQCQDPRTWLGHPIATNASAAYVPPLGRRVLTVLASADPASVSKYGSAIAPLFNALCSTSHLSLLMGGCSGLMGSGAPFCAKGELGFMCNVYDGFWKGDIDNKRTGTDCIEFCETRLSMKVYLLDNAALEEEILTGGRRVGMGDAFVLLPGGIGTTREMYDVLHANFEYSGVNKPIFCLNVGPPTVAEGGFFDEVLAWLRQLYARQLLKPYSGSAGSSLFVASDAEVLAAAIDRWAVTGELPEELRFENLYSRSVVV